MREKLSPLVKTNDNLNESKELRNKFRRGILASE
jgi:hypothetical protein